MVPQHKLLSKLHWIQKSPQLLKYSKPKMLKRCDLFLICCSMVRWKLILNKRKPDMLLIHFNRDAISIYSEPWPTQTSMWTRSKPKPSLSMEMRTQSCQSIRSWVQRRNWANYSFGKEQHIWFPSKCHKNTTQQSRPLSKMNDLKIKIKINLNDCLSHSLQASNNLVDINIF